MVRFELVTFFVATVQPSHMVPWELYHTQAEGTYNTQAPRY